MDCPTAPLGRIPTLPAPLYGLPRSWRSVFRLFCIRQRNPFGNAIDLWRGLEAGCSGDCDFLTIPHNMNKSWGLFYSRHTWDGGTYDEEGWRLRRRREPLAEIYQIKGASECALGVGATDEECAFSQVFEPCEQG